MNQTQRRYALRRLDEIKKRKIEEARIKFTTKVDGWTPEETAKKFISGKLKYKCGAPKVINNYTRFGDVFQIGVCSSSIDSKKFNEAYIKIVEKYNEISDNLMLSDAKDAVKALAEMEKFDANV